MKTGFSLALVFFASAMLLAAAETYQAVNVVPPSPPREFRGAWIATVANKDWPSAPGLSVAQQKAELIALLDTAARLKMNTVIFQVRPSCDAFYVSSMEPWSYYLTGVPGQAPQPYYDPLAFAIEEAHKRGLQLHAWFNPFRVRLASTEPLAMNSLARTHPDWVRDYGGQLWLDPGNPAVRDYVVRIIMDVVRRYDIDGVQFDDYFYPYPAPAAPGYPLPFPDETTWRAYGMHSGESHNDWRRQNINQFIEDVSQNIKAAKPWVQFGVSPFGIWRPGYPPSVRGLDPYATLFADSRLWLANGWVDYLAPQLYWSIDAPAQSYPVLLNWWAQQNVKHRNLWPGLAAHLLPPAEIARQIQVTRMQPGASGEMIFHLKLIEDNPPLADAIAREYAQPAFVPPSPWLASAPLARPQVTVHGSNYNWTFQWAMAGTPPANWLLQIYGSNDTWTTKILPGYQTTQNLSFSPQAVSLRAMDRAGNLGPAMVVGLTGVSNSSTTSSPSASPKPAGNNSGSFWGSHKW